jgi:hypothetical protein
MVSAGNMKEDVRHVEVSQEMMIMLINDNKLRTAKSFLCENLLCIYGDHNFNLVNCLLLFHIHHFHGT